MHIKSSFLAIDFRPKVGDDLDANVAEKHYPQKQNEEQEPQPSQGLAVQHLPATGKQEGCGQNGQRRDGF